jgi:hypothetical protein
VKFYKRNTIGTQTSFSTNFGAKLSFIPSFLFPECLRCCYIYIFTPPTCTTTIITYEPCALYAEFQHFILRYFLTLRIPLKEGTGGEREGDFMDNFISHESRKKQNPSAFLTTYWNLSLTSGEFGPFLLWRFFCIGWNHIFQVKVWWIFANKRNFASKSSLRPTMRKE